jgi:hypothetical protein
MYFNSASNISALPPDLLVNEAGVIYHTGLDPELFGSLYPEDYDPPTMDTPPVVPSACSSTELQTLATATSSGGGVGSYGPEQANDGNTGYPENPNCYGPNCFYWGTTSGANATGCWLQFTWTSSQDICGLWCDTKASATYEGGSRLDRCAGNARIQYWDGSAWQQDGTVSGYFDDWNYTFTSCTTTTRIRLMDITQNAAGGCTLDYNYCRNPMIYELCVFECSGGPPPTATPTNTPAATNTPAPGTPTNTPGPSTPTATPDPSARTVDIDIKPHNPINPVNLKSHGELKFAVFSSETFDAMDINPNSVKLSGASVVIKHGKAKMKGQFVNDDDLMDAVFHVYTDELTLGPLATEATATGMTYSMISWKGTDMVHIVAPKVP